jgi:hypothetical protein
VSKNVKLNALQQKRSFWPTVLPENATQQQLNVVTNIVAQLQKRVTPVVSLVSASQERQQSVALVE